MPKLSKEDQNYIVEQIIGLDDSWAQAKRLGLPTADLEQFVNELYRQIGAEPPYEDD